MSRAMTGERGRKPPVTTAGPVPYERDVAANAFAMELLMPRAVFMREARAVPDLNDEEAMRRLAKRFGVSVPVATARLIDLAQSEASPTKLTGSKTVPR